MPAMARRKRNGSLLAAAAVVAAYCALRAVRDEPRVPTEPGTPIVACEISGGADRVAAVHAEAASRPTAVGGASTRAVAAAPFAEPRAEATVGTIVLRAVDAANGAPVVAAKATVYGAAMGGTPALADARTDADGVATLTPLPPRAVDVVVAAAGYAFKSERVRLSRGRLRVALTVRLPALPRIAGRVVDEAGGPISGARVQARGSGGPAETTAGDGSFSVAVFAFPNADPAATLGTVDVEHPLFAPHAAEIVHGGTIVLPRTRPRLTGAVRTVLGTPVAGARVSAANRYAGDVVAEPRRVATVLAGPDGAFELPELSPGPLEVEVVAEGFFRAFAPPAQLVSGSPIPVLPLDPSTTPAPFVVVLSRARTTAGEVRWDDGEPVAGAVVRALGTAQQWVSDAAAPTASDGGFAIELPEDEPVAFYEVAPPRGRLFVVPPPAPSRDGVVRLTVAREPTRRGRVLDAETDLPIAGAEIAVWDGWMWGPGSVSSSDADGYVDVLKAMREPQRWIVRAATYAPGSFAVPTDPAPRILTVRLDRAGAVGGFVGAHAGVEVRRPDGGPAEDPRLGFHRERATSDALGYFEIDDLAPGRYRLIVYEREGAVVAERDVEIAAGSLTRFDL